MDRSFLSNTKVIEAAQNFVCIRLATYEDKEEAEFLKKLFRGRTGELENTVFVLLSPDAKERLCRAGRGPNFEFRTPRDLAREMNQIAKRYEPTTQTKKGAAILPQMKNVRLAINVGACDGIPTVIVYAPETAQLDKMKSTLASIATKPDLAGKFIYGSTNQTKDLKLIEELVEGSKPGYLVVSPGDYGLAAKLIVQIDAQSDAEVLRQRLLAIAKKTSKNRKDHHRHVRNGRNSDKNWETEIPVTDPMSLRAMNRRK